jgi:hypothetical protein
MSSSLAAEYLKQVYSQKLIDGTAWKRAAKIIRTKKSEIKTKGKTAVHLRHHVNSMSKHVQKRNKIEENGWANRKRLTNITEMKEKAKKLKIGQKPKKNKRTVKKNSSDEDDDPNEEPGDEEKKQTDEKTETETKAKAKPKTKKKKKAKKKTEFDESEEEEDDADDESEPKAEKNQESQMTDEPVTGRRSSRQAAQSAATKTEVMQSAENLEDEDDEEEEEEQEQEEDEEMYLEDKLGLNDEEYEDGDEDID